jgi:hypothetical protein
MAANDRKTHPDNRGTKIWDFGGHVDNASDFLSGDDAANEARWDSQMKAKAAQQRMLAAAPPPTAPVRVEPSRFQAVSPTDSAPQAPSAVSPTDAAPRPGAGVAPYQGGGGGGPVPHQPRAVSPTDIQADIQKQREQQIMLSLMGGGGA